MFIKRIKGPIDDNALNNINHNFGLSDVLRTQINDLVLDSGESNAEVAQARGGHQVLSDRLNETDQQLADKADEDEVRKRTDIYPINVKEMDTETKKLFTGGNVAVVGENAVGRENIKNSAVIPNKTSFLTIDKELNLYDGSYTNKSIVGGQGSFTISSNDNHRTLELEIKPNTRYSVIKKESDTFKIATDTVVGRESGELEGKVQFNILEDDYRIFVTGESDVALYVQFTRTKQDVFIQIVEGSQRDFTVHDYRYVPADNLDVYSKKEVDSILGKFMTSQDEEWV